MSNIRDLKGAFSLINILDDEDSIDTIICAAIEHDLNIDDLSDDDYAFEAVYY